MKSKLTLVLLTITLLINVKTGFSQVLISNSTGNTPDASAMLEIQSNDKGLLIPRMDSTTRKSISNPAEGLLVYDSQYKAFFIYGKNSKGKITWYNISSNAGLWSQEGSSVYLSNSTYNVGIGTTTPNKKLVIKAQNSTDTLLEILDQNGLPLMIVTPSLTKFNIIKANEKNKGTAGGFAVGRYSLAKATVQDTDLFVVTHDSTRVYTGTAGGFAVGRYSLAKGSAKKAKFFFTSVDSTRVYTDGSGKKGTAGGFAVGRYSLAKGAKAGSGNYMYMVPDNYFIGDQSGEKMQTGLYSGIYNTFFGYQTGKNTTVGKNNVFIGYKSGLKNVGQVSGPDTLGSRNVFLGYEAGFNNTNGSDNVLLGYQAGHEVTTAGNNISIGSEAGYRNTNNSDNIFLGRQAGYNHTGDGVTANSANNNIYLGYKAGFGNVSGDRGENNIFMGTESGTNNYFGHNNVFLGNNSGTNNYGSNSINVGSFNVFIGESSGYSNTDGYKNTFIGFQSGYSNTTGNSNIFIGLEAGKMNSSGINSVYIGNYAGRNSTESGNVCIGKYSGSQASGNQRAFLGEGSGYASIGNNNTYLGSNAGFDSNAGENNVYVGHEAGYEADGSSNVYIGNFACGSANSGNKNVMIGGQAGGLSENGGSGNIFMGYKAGYNETGSNKLYIENNEDNTPLIYGEFDRGYLQINDTLNIAGQYNMPSTNGNAGQVLLTNGSNTAYWADQSSLNDADWTVSGSNMYSAVSGNVGIGTSSPGEKLEIAGAFTDSPGIILTRGTSSDVYADWRAEDSGGYLGIDTRSTGGWNRVMTLDPNNYNVGIGTTSPDDKFQVESTSDVSAKILSGDGYASKLKLFEGADYGFEFEYDGANDQLNLWSRKFSGNEAVRLRVNKYGNVYMPGVYDDGTSNPSRRVLYINPDGQLVYLTSSRRYKKDITDMKDISWLYKLRPVNFHYKNDKSNILEYGFIAEEVDTVNKDFVSYNKDGSVETVYYSRLISPTIKALQEEHKENLKQKEEIQELKQQIQELKDLIQNK